MANAAKVKISFAQIPNVHRVRNRLGLSQTDFWRPVGVTQSGGSRYESGRSIPRPVRALLRIVYDL